MPRRLRLDAELVRRGMARSREHARDLVAAGRVTVAGIPASKPATGVGTDAALVVVDDPGPPAYVSRGAHKLVGALDLFGTGGLTATGRRCLDAGASTGGFTDVLLRRGAREVVAVDVGYGQLAWRLRQDRRVRVVERTNVRRLCTQTLGGPVDLAVGDLSFISLRLVLRALVGVLDPGGDLLVMVKPQFEVGRGNLGRGGVVRASGARAEAVLSVKHAARDLGWESAGVTTSPLPGPAGNIEYFLWLRRGITGLPDSAVSTEVGRTSDPGAAGEKVET